MRVTLAASGFDEGSGGVAKGQVEIFIAQDRVDGIHGLLIALPFGRQSVSLDSDLEPVDVVPVPPFMASSTGPSTFSFNSKPVLSGFAQTNSI